MNYQIPSICPYCQSNTDIQLDNEASCEDDEHEFWFHVYRNTHINKIDEYWFILHKKSNLIIDHKGISYNHYVIVAAPPLLTFSHKISMQEAISTLDRFLKLHAFI
jgi:hypothetical protein